MSQTPNKAKGSSAKNEFICKIRYSNALPDIPFDPKFLTYPFNKNRFVKYSTTSLEKNFKSVLHTEPDMGIPIDIIDPNAYKIPEGRVVLPSEDQRLLEPITSEGGSSKKRRMEKIRPVVPWLQKTHYVTSLSKEVKKREKKDEVEKPAMSRYDMISAIENTFEAANEIPVHPKNPNMKGEVFPVFPDEDLWPNAYLNVIFDNDPIPKDTSLTPSEQENLRNEAVLKNYSIDEGNNFLAYMIPKKRKRSETDEIEEEEEFEWIREYSYQVRKGSDFNNSFFFLLGEKEVTYTRIATRINVDRRTTDNNFSRPEKITLVTKEMNEIELKKREESLMNLQNPEPEQEIQSNNRQNEEEEEQIED
eukprot:TRINITY_DN4987_c0_g4_i1.p1 TRINITY_DN4987_c0_g4~~TRINITY_DN4987_c0_g4_i1.p1  ORF type:complete len:362 (-),score=114.00 TRINITY_DN4987_c0_g4_i1:66-1151(-)